MSQLSPKARALVHAARGAERPTAADRERVRRALEARLGAAALGPESADALAGGAAPSPSVLPPAGTSFWLVSGVVAGVGVIGAVLALALRPPSSPDGSAKGLHPPVAATSVVPTLPVTETRSEQPLPPAPVTSSPPAATTAELPAYSSRPKQDRLALEVALLSRATSNLHAGRAVEALKALDEHQRSFPNGLLAQERRAARAQALCSLGRVREAQADLARLAPRSPAVAHAKRVCEAAARR